MSTLIVIPARAGSKGIPGKNTKLISGMPLISHSIEFALKICGSDDHIVISSDDAKVINIASAYSEYLTVIKRPDYLSTDTAGMTDVLRHAIEYGEKRAFKFERILLLQPTSPLRIVDDYLRLCSLMDQGYEMVVSVKKSKQNPYYNLFEEDDEGFLIKSKPGSFTCRQDCPEVFEYNGSMYLAKKESLLKFGLHGMTKVKKMLMSEELSVDIDDHFDWAIAEALFSNSKFITKDNISND
jgi:CMP-N,N'-diacetyllegionaminic acid synthase